MNAWFRYERDFSCRWCPVVIWDDDKPSVPKDGGATPAVSVPPGCLASDGSPMFGRLQAMFPLPREES